MPTYTVHQPPLREGKAVPGPERFVFVRDGFHFWAFVLPPLWLLLRRLWLVLVLYVVASAMLGVALYFVNLPAAARFIIGLLTGLLIGMEAATLWRWTLVRRGWTLLGFVVAEDDEEAERRFFAQWSVRTPIAATPLASAPLATPVPQQKPPDVIGLFPQPGAAR